MHKKLVKLKKILKLMGLRVNNGNINIPYPKKIFTTVRLKLIFNYH